jgi:hypothetical protein
MVGRDQRLDLVWWAAPASRPAQTSFRCPASATTYRYLHSKQALGAIYKSSFYLVEQDIHSPSDPSHINISEALGNQVHIVDSLALAGSLEKSTVPYPNPLECAQHFQSSVL